MNNLTQKLKDNKFFGVGFDASNKGNQKCYPICVRYFDVQAGVCHRILDLYEDSRESASAMSEQILDRIPKHELNLSQVSSFTADTVSYTHLYIF